MGSAFYSEAPIWPWVRDPRFVMFALNAPNIVCHLAHAECPEEWPHPVQTCGRFADRAEPTTGVKQ